MDEQEGIIELSARRGRGESDADDRDVTIAKLAAAWERALVELFGERAAA